MEVKFQNSRTDFEAFYKYMVENTDQGRQITKQAIRAQHLSIIVWLLLVPIIQLLNGNWLFTIGMFILGSVVIEGMILFKSQGNPQYYGIQSYRQQEKFITEKDLALFLLPKILSYDSEWIEIRNSEVSHKYRWRRVDNIGITNDFIFIHVGVCPVVYVPKRDFPSETDFLTTGEELRKLKAANTSTPLEG
jgi:hypothetical protein